MTLIYILLGIVVYLGIGFAVAWRDFVGELRTVRSRRKLYTDELQDIALTAAINVPAWIVTVPTNLARWAIIKLATRLEKPGEKGR